MARKKIAVATMLILFIVSSAGAQTWQEQDGLFASILKWLMPDNLTFDDDETLSFYWIAATEAVSYNVKLWDNGLEYAQTWTTNILPTATTPYAVPIAAEVSHIYRLAVQGVDGAGQTGPWSEPSDPVLRVPAQSSDSRPEPVD